MGLVRTNIEIQNGDDASDFDRGRIGEDEIRQIEVIALADTGSIMLCINEEIRNALGLRVIDQRISELADGGRVKFPVTSSVVVRFGDRFCSTNALVLPGDCEPLLGAVPMELMDLYVNPGRGEVAPVHKEGYLYSLKKVRF